MTGVTTGELMEFQLRHGVNLPCNVVLRDVTVDGIVSCMSHVRFIPVCQTGGFVLRKLTVWVDEGHGSRSVLPEELSQKHSSSESLPNFSSRQNKHLHIHFTETL